jgi:hypothetical protein
LSYLIIITHDFSRIDTETNGRSVRLVSSSTGVCPVEQSGEVQIDNQHRRTRAAWAA